MYFSKQEVQDFDKMRQQYGEAFILDQMIERNPKKKSVLDSLRQSGLDDATITDEFLKRKSTWKMSEQAFSGLSPSYQKSYKEKYNIELMPTPTDERTQEEKILAEEMQPIRRKQPPSLTDFGKGLAKGFSGQTGREWSEDMRARYRQLMRVVPSAQKLRTAIDEKNTQQLAKWMTDGKILTPDQIIAQLGEEEGGKLVQRMARIGKGKLFAESATKMSRGVPSTLFKIGSFEVTEALYGPEQLLDPVELASNLATVGLGGRIVKDLGKKALKSGGKEAIAWFVHDYPTAGYIARMAIQGDVPQPKVGGGSGQSLAQYKNFLNKNLSKKSKAVLKQVIEEGVPIENAWSHLQFADPNDVTGTALKKRLIQEIKNQYVEETPEVLELLRRANELPTKDFDNIAAGWKASLANDLDKVDVEKIEVPDEWLKRAQEKSASKQRMKPEDVTLEDVVSETARAEDMATPITTPDSSMSKMQFNDSMKELGYADEAIDEAYSSYSRRAIQNVEPIHDDAMQAMLESGMDVPDGYVKQGDRWVFDQQAVGGIQARVTPQAEPEIPTEQVVQEPSPQAEIDFTAKPETPIETPVSPVEPTKVELPTKVAEAETIAPEGQMAMPETPTGVVAEGQIVGEAVQEGVEEVAEEGMGGLFQGEGGFARFGKPQQPSLAQNLDPANQAKIDSYSKGISFKGEKGVRGSIGEGFHNLYRGFVSRYHPIDRLTKFAQKGGVDIPEGQNPALLAKKYSGVEAITNVKLFDQTFKILPDGSYQVTGDGLSKVIKPVAQDIEDFSTFLAIQRDIEKLGQNIKGTPEQAQVHKAYRAMRDKYGTNLKVFEDAADEFRAWERRAMLDELLDIGYLSKTQYDDILENNQYHAPFQRVIDEMEGMGAIPTSKEVFTPKGKPIHGMKGSERQVIDPLENAVMNTYRITDFVERQKVSNAVVGLRDIDPRLQNVITEGRGKYEIRAFENGKAKYYNVPKDLHTALKGMDEVDVDKLTRVIGAPTRALRAGVTLAPEFPARNIVRDQFTNFVNAKFGFNIGVDFGRGLFHMAKKDDLYKEWLAAGGDHSMFFALDRTMNRAKMQDVIRGKKKLLNIRHPVEALRDINEIFERGTRVGTYARARSGGDLLYKAFHRGEGLATPLQAMFEAREAGTDFSRRGAWTKGLNQLIPFFNANIQGVDKMVRTFKQRPIEASIRAISSITIPTLALYSINKDNPRYQQLPQWQKDFFWIIIPSEDSPIIRIPKPFELGIIFGTAAERIWQYIDERDPEALKELGESGKQALLPGVVPTILSPYIEAKTNKNLFTGRPIVPGSLERFPDEMQFESYTSETAKAIGTFAKYSPMKIDNTIRGYFGGLGKLAVDAADAVIKPFQVDVPPEPSKTAADIPLIRGFVAKEPIGSMSQSVTDFYKEYEDMQKYNNAIRRYSEVKNAKKAREYAEKHPEYKFVKGFNAVALSMAKIRTRIQAVYDSPDMSPENKRETIDKLNGLITQQAERAMEALNNFRDPVEQEPEEDMEEIKPLRYE